MNGRTTCLILLLLTVGTVRADDAPLNLYRPEATTIDKELFPPACRRGFEVELPVVGKALDALPEEAFPHIFSLQSKSDSVARWRRMLIRRHIDLDDYQYIASGGNSDADAVLIAIDHGRVQQLGYFFPFLKPAQARSFLSPFRTIGTHAVADDRSFEVTVAGIRFYGHLVGEHPWSKSIPGPIAIDGVNGVSTSPDLARTGSYPALIEIGVDARAWYLATHDLSPVLAANIISGNLAAGMSLDDANAAIGFAGTLLGDSHESQTLQWSGTPPGAAAAQQMQATFVDGRLTSFQRATLSSTP